MKAPHWHDWDALMVTSLDRITNELVHGKW